MHLKAFGIASENLLWLNLQKISSCSVHLLEVCIRMTAFVANSFISKYTENCFAENKFPTCLFFGDFFPKFSIEIKRDNRSYSTNLSFQCLVKVHSNLCESDDLAVAGDSLDPADSNSPFVETARSHTWSIQWDFRAVAPANTSVRRWIPGEKFKQNPF